MSMENDTAHLHALEDIRRKAAIRIVVALAAAGLALVFVSWLSG